jgi:uncharacterized protein YjbI with pentapeptide repeats
MRLWRPASWSNGSYKAIAAFILFLSLIIFSYPGEPQLNLLTFRSLGSYPCDASPGFFLGIDRIVLKDTNIAQPDKKAVASANINDPSENSILWDWGGRNFSCGTFVGIDFRRTNLTDAHFEGASLSGSIFDKTTHMSGVFLDDADLSQLELNGLHFEQASFYRTKLKGATLTDVQLGAATKFVGIDLSLAKLNNVAFAKGAEFSGAIMTRAELTGVQLPEAHLEGAGLQHSILRNQF